MASTALSSMKAVRNSQPFRFSLLTRRKLHITTSNSLPQAYNQYPKRTDQRPTLSELGDECQQRGSLLTGTKYKLTMRLANHKSMGNRAYSIAMRPLSKSGLGVRSRPPESVGGGPTRRHLKMLQPSKVAKNPDAMDATYLPKLFDGSLDPPPRKTRVPILPDVDSVEARNTLSHKAGNQVAAGNVEEAVQSNVVNKAQIVTAQETMADGGAHVELDLNAQPSSICEMVDNTATEIGIDKLTNLTETVSQSARKLVDPAEESVVRQVWNGFLDDLFGQRQSHRGSGKEGRV